MHTVCHFIGGTGSGYVASSTLNLDNKYYFSFEDLYFRDIFWEINFNKKVNTLPSSLVEPFNHEDSSFPKFKKYINDNNIESCDIQISVPPCKGLSTLARDSHEQKIDNVWILKAVEWYLAQDNEILIIENARDLAEKRGKAVLDRILKIIKLYGDDHKVQVVKTQASHHNVLQSRTRTFLIVYKGSPVILKDVFRTTVGINDVFKRPKDFDINYHPYHFQPNQRPTFNEFIQFITDHNLWDFFREEAKLNRDKRFSVLDYLLNKDYEVEENVTIFQNYPNIYKYLDTNLRRCDKNGRTLFDKSPVFFHDLSKTVNARNAYLLVHPKYNRYISLLEMMDLQGVPDTFIFPDVNILDKCRFIFRYVPTNMMIDFIRYGIGIIEKDMKYVKKVADNSYNLIYQNNIKRKIETDIILGAYK